MSSDDAAILVAFENIAKELEVHSDRCPVSVSVMSGYPTNKILLSKIWSHPLAQHSKQREGASWESISIQFMELELNINVNRDRDLGVDNIRVSFAENPPDPVDVSRSIVAIHRQFIPLNQHVAIERALGPEMAEFYRLREDGLSRLERLTQRIVEETHDYRIRVDAELADHKRSLSDSFDEKNKVLEAKYDERSSELESKERHLAKLREELDDRSARQARREQSRALQTKISKRSESFSLTSSTKQKRLPIHAMFIVLLILSGMSIFSFLLSSPLADLEDTALWLAIGRLLLSTIGFALTAVFYIRWNDQWFRQHADQEFRLQQLALDVDRAGYASEMLLEWQEDKGGQMPAVMVDRLTAGLFTDQTVTTPVRHPYEDVTAVLLKAASNIRVDVPGIGELTLPGRKVRKLDKNLAEKREA